MADDLHSLAAPYALHALDEAEEREFERHLPLCERCRNELAGLRDAAAALAYGVDAPEPPPDLRERILAQARSERPNVVPLRRQRRWMTPGVGVAVAAVAACAALGLGIWAASRPGPLGQADARALKILADPKAKRLPLTGANGVVAVAPNREAALVVTGLRAVPSGKTYEAWVIRGGIARRAAVFAGRSGRLVVALAPRVEPGAVVGVTIERRGGVDQPTSSPIFSSGAA
jgi:anti-sigma-K factor RskA